MRSASFARTSPVPPLPPSPSRNGRGAPSARSTRRASPRPTCMATSTSRGACSPPSICAASSPTGTPSPPFGASSSRGSTAKWALTSAGSPALRLRQRVLFRVPRPQVPSVLAGRVYERGGDAGAGRAAQARLRAGGLPPPLRLARAPRGRGVGLLRRLRGLARRRRDHAHHFARAVRLPLRVVRHPHPSRAPLRGVREHLRLRAEGAIRRGGAVRVMEHLPDYSA